MLIDNGKNSFNLIDEKQKEIIFGNSFEDVLKWLFYMMDKYGFCVYQNKKDKCFVFEKRCTDKLNIEGCCCYRRWDESIENGELSQLDIFLEVIHLMFRTERLGHMFYDKTPDDIQKITEFIDISLLKHIPKYIYSYYVESSSCEEEDA